MNGKIFGWLRKPWMSEDYRMSIFDAIAFGMAFLSAKR